MWNVVEGLSTLCYIDKGQCDNFTKKIQRVSLEGLNSNIAVVFINSMPKSTGLSLLLLFVNDII